LHQALQPIAEQNINLVKIESRPIVGHPFEYCFYLDLMAAPQAPATKAALDDLRRRTREVRILGCYVAAPAPGAA
jgi:chorismate mutase/prephenate dehydratase